MSRMRHLLRKLHIGGGGGGGGSSSGGVDHQPHHHPHPHQHQRLGGEASRNPSPTSASSSRARAQDAAPVEAVESREGSRSDGATIAGPDFSLFEEEYQVQLALAISTSDPDGLEDADSVQIKAAKRMSLGCPPGVGAAAGAVVGVGADDDSSMEFLSLRYWVSLNCIFFAVGIRLI